MKEPTVAAVVLNWNLPEDTIRCIRSLERSDYAALRVLVVDNGSSDDSLERLARELPNIEVIATGKNLYFAGGANVGLKAALSRGADWVLVLNNDTVAAPDLVGELVRAAQTLDAGLLAPVIYRLDRPQEVWDAGTHWPRWSPLPRRARLEATAYRVDLVTGCGLMVAAGVLAACGGFNERYAMYYEDADLSLRCRRKGVSIYVAPRAHLWHAVGKSASLASARSAAQRAQFRLLFYRDHARWPWRPVTLAMVTGHVLWTAFLAAAAGKREVALAQLRGFLAGWRPARRLSHD